MSDTSTIAELFVVAIQDLYDAEQGWIERCTPLSESAGKGLRTFLTDEHARATAQAQRLATILGDREAALAGQPNIWLRAILEDAARDATTIEAGALRDIALCGAFRKGKQSERVSYETAIGLAERLSDERARKVLNQCRDEEAEADARLKQLLDVLIDDA